MIFVIDNSFLINAIGLDTSIEESVENFLKNHFLLNSTKIYAPNLIKYEMASTIYHKLHKDPVVPIDIIFKTISKFNINFYDFTYAELKDILNISLRHNQNIKSKKDFLTTYDSSYIYLAKKLKAKLLTEDQLLKKYC